MNKKLIAILTLAVFMLTLMPMGAFAASVNRTVGFAPLITDVGAVTVASVRIHDDGEAGNFGNGVFELNLPAGVEWQNKADVEAVIKAAIEDGLGGAAGVATVTRSSGRTVTVILAGLTAANNDDFTIPMPINVTTVGTGDLKVEIRDINTGINSEEMVIARFESGSAAARMMTAPTRAVRDTSFGNIRITENTPGALSAGDTITLRLPANVEWNYTAGTQIQSSTHAPNTTNLVAISGLTDRRVTFEVSTASTTNPAIWDITTPVLIDSSARTGDVNVTIGGTANVSPGTLKIGAYADYGVTIVAADPEVGYSGRTEIETATITITETVPGTIVPNRDITFKLPSGVRFVSNNEEVRRISGADLFATTPANFAFNSSNSEFSLTPSDSSGGGTAAKYEIRNLEIRAAANFTGPVELEVVGAAGVQGKLVIAEIKRPISVESTPSDIEIGRQSQAINDFYIIEVAPERLSQVTGANQLIIRLPENSGWSRVPTVEVVEGDLEIGTVTRDGTTRNLIIPIDTESTVASKIKVSNAAITTNRSIAEGNINASITDAATALVNTTFVNRNTLVSFQVATVVTPAVDGTVKPVVMTVGSTVYTVDGVEMTMDVAPYVKTGRTFFPVRFVASAVGIGNDNVVWDGAQRTVTIFRSNRIVQVTIESTTMLVNGIPVMMDVAPEITGGRTMLPIRWVAQGLGVNVDWDAATQTVTLN